MQHSGYIFIRNGEPNPEKDEYFTNKATGEMVKAVKTGIRPVHAAIYKKWEDYIRPSDESSCIQREDYFGKLEDQHQH